MIDDDLTNDCPLAGALAIRLRASRNELTARWLERIVARVSVDPNRIFPTDELLNHVPLLIDGIAAYMEDPGATVNFEAPVVGKAMELGALRYAQGFDAYEILKEYEILGGILFSYLAREADAMPDKCEKSELLACGHRVFRAIAIIQQATTTHYLRLAAVQVREREERIRYFNRTLSHEIKNLIGTVLGAGDVLHEIPDMAPEQRARFVDIIRRNGRAMQAAVSNILTVTRQDHGARQQRNILLAAAAREAIRQLRETASSSEVDVRLGDDLPEVEVNAAGVELCLTNYLSNAIKYADPGKPHRWVEVNGALEEREGRREVVVRVRDNGLGVPLEKRDALFQHFFRAHETVTDAEGTGLGLSIVRETATALGGSAWAEFPPEGAVFAFSFPERRAAAAPQA
jgi:signal transduction histidine kinase